MRGKLVFHGHVVFLLPAARVVVILACSRSAAFALVVFFVVVLFSSPQMRGCVLGGAASPAAAAQIAVENVADVRSALLYPYLKFKRITILTFVKRGNTFVGNKSRWKKMVYGLK